MTCEFMGRRTALEISAPPRPTRSFLGEANPLGPAWTARRGSNIVEIQRLTRRITRLSTFGDFRLTAQAA